MERREFMGVMGRRARLIVRWTIVGLTFNDAFCIRFMF